jgi:hypothetical protein
MSLIDLRFSTVAPPDPEPLRQIYCDIVNLPDPLTMALGVRIFNLDSSALYMKVDATADAWTFTAAELGILGAGSNFYRNLTSFGERARPGTPRQEALVVTLYAYSDSGYSNLVWTLARNIAVEYIQSDDETWTSDFVNNFDDGTIQGWDAHPIPCGTGAGIGVVTDYVLSVPYALRWYCNHTTSQTDWDTYFFKSFTTPDRNQVFMIADFRIDHSTASDRGVYAEVDGIRTLICKINAPQDTWMRLVVPLPIDSMDVAIRIGQTYFNGASDPSKMWLDDFKIISKIIEPPPIDLSKSEGIAFYWWGSGGLDQQIDFEIESPTGSWVGKFYDGPAMWRWVFLEWSDLIEVDLDGSRPDRSNVRGIFWTYHTDGVRRVDYIVGWRRQDLRADFEVRGLDSAELLCKFDVGQDSAELLGKFEAQATVELLGKFDVGQGSVELLGEFEVGQGSAELLGKAEIQNAGSAELLSKAVIPWLIGWSYRKEVTLVEQSSGDYNDYPTIITVAYNAHMKNDFSDCRFTEADEMTLIDYGIVEKTDGVSCDFVIKRNYTSGGTLTAYLYYGNSGAADASVDHGPWALAWYLANGFGQNPSAFTNTTCSQYPHSATEDVPAWAATVFGGCNANGGFNAYYGRAKINGTAVAWATTVVCNGIGDALLLKWLIYRCTVQQYDHGSFVAGASNTVTWGHYHGPNPGFWVSYYPTDPSVSFGPEEP